MSETQQSVRVDDEALMYLELAHLLLARAASLLVGGLGLLVRGQLLELLLVAGPLLGLLLLRGLLPLRVGGLGLLLGSLGPLLVRSGLGLHAWLVVEKVMSTHERRQVKKESDGVEGGFTAGGSLTVGRWSMRKMIMRISVASSSICSGVGRLSSNRIMRLLEEKTRHHRISASLGQMVSIVVGGARTRSRGGTGRRCE